MNAFQLEGHRVLCANCTMRVNVVNARYMLLEATIRATKRGQEKTNRLGIRFLNHLTHRA